MDALQKRLKINWLDKKWQKRPLYLILAIALLLRLIASVFSQGYGMHDDHFSIIEASQSWVDGTDYNDWLPSTQDTMRYRFSEYSFLFLKEKGVPDSIVDNLTILERRGYYHESDFTNNIEKHLGISTALQYMDIIEQSATLGSVPDGHSFFYVGIHYVILKTFATLGVNDPKIKMFLIRLLHALFSLLIIWAAYHITLKLSNQKNAKQVGLLLAVLWFMPFLSVRNLVEIACIPFLLIGLLYLIKDDSLKNVLKASFLAGLIMAIAFSVRFQTAVFIGGAGLALLLMKRWKEAFMFGFGGLLSIIIIQGGIDMFVWGRPFAELEEYIRYNLVHKNEYGHNAYEMYIAVLAGVIVPPIGLFYLWGVLRSYKKYLLIFVPVIVFIAFHTYFPNKQERFIFPVIPAYILLGVMGWNDFVEKSKFWMKRPKLLKGSYTFFWVVNIFMLLIFTTFYSKKARVESMYYFYDKPEVETVLIEESYRGGAVFLPNFYSGRWLQKYKLDEPKDTTKLWSYKRQTRHTKEIKSYKYFDLNPQEKKPQYILFVHEKQLKERLEKAKVYFPKLEFAQEFTPSFGDKILHGLNPVNRNVPIYVYKTNL